MAEEKQQVKTQAGEIHPLTTRIPKELYKRMMRLKTEEGDELRDQVREALDSYLKGRGF